MKGLWKYIPPFAPDQSGACAVLCELGGLIVIIDAGGCAGNICGFDEPRWFASKSAIFSAGLRDMDAILGRDEKLVEKTVKACQQIEGSFVALVGTPVPAVIGTDYKALKRMIEKRTGLPVLTAQSTGTGHYDQGAREMYLELVDTFVKKTQKSENPGEGETLYLGAIPLDTDGISRQGWFGQGAGLEALEHMESYDRIQVLAPSGWKAAKAISKKTGISYSLGYPLESLEAYDKFEKFIAETKDKQAYRKVLIVHQQILAHSLREALEESWKDTKIHVASWFDMIREIRREGDCRLKEEEDWIKLVKEGDYDLIIADTIMQKAIPFYHGSFLPLSHYALSGRMPSLEGFSL